MSRFKKYERYKNTEFNYIGEIPYNWDIGKVKQIFQERNKKNNPILSKERLSLSIDKGVTLYSEKTTNLDRYKEDFSQYKLTYQNDLVLNSMNMIVGAAGISKYFGCVSPTYYVLYSRSFDKYNPHYFAYFFKTRRLQEKLYSLGKGIMAIERGNGRINTCRLKVSRQDLKILNFPIPPIEEQNQIVNFITYKEKQINKLIRKQKRLIELLEEKKKVIITEAVTKGLDKNAPMKDSGIEWIGKIPNNWNVIKFKFLADIKNGGDYKDVEVASGGYPVMGSGGEFARASKYLYNKPSILLGRKGTIGKPIYMDEPFWCVDTMFYSEVSKNVYPKFLFYASHLIRYEYYQTSTALPSMTQRDIGNEFIRIPDYNNQILISNYLDKKCKNFNDIIDNKESIITKLEEYKKSLISSAVTGQIDIRDYEIKDIIEDDTIEQVEEENNLSESEVEYANC